MQPIIELEKMQGTDELLKRFAPDQGGIEYQTDQPGKVHAWHSHSVHETLVVLNGSMTLSWKDSTGQQHNAIAEAGQRIELPTNTIHQSVNNSDAPCRYLIIPEGGTAAETTRY